MFALNIARWKKFPSNLEVANWHHIGARNNTILIQPRQSGVRISRFQIQLSFDKLFLSLIMLHFRWLRLHTYSDGSGLSHSSWEDHSKDHPTICKLANHLLFLLARMRDQWRSYLEEIKQLVLRPRQSAQHCVGRCEGWRPVRTSTSAVVTWWRNTISSSSLRELSPNN